MNELDSRTIRRIKSIEAAITGRALTVNEISAKIFAVPQSVGEYVRHLLDPDNQRIHIERWRRTPGHIVAAYRWGAGKNAPKPSAKTDVEVTRDRMARMRKDIDAYDRYLAGERARYVVRKAKTPQNWASALLGAAAREVRHA